MLIKWLTLIERADGSVEPTRSFRMSRGMMSAPMSSSFPSYSNKCPLSRTFRGGGEGTLFKLR